MKPRHFLATATGAALALVGVTPAVAEPVEELVVRYDVTETDGNMAVDSSAFGNDGRLRGGVTRRNGAYRFHPSTRFGRYDRIVAPSDASMNPGSAPFSYGARVKVRPNAKWSDTEMALIRHGDADTPGGDYKLELRRHENGVVDALCEMSDRDRDGHGFVLGNGRTTINDGRWHTISCARVDEDTVSVTVDGRSKERPTTGNLGSIVGDDPFLLGCQPAEFAPRRWREQLHGAMDDIYLTVLREPSDPSD